MASRIAVFNVPGARLVAYITAFCRSVTPGQSMDDELITGTNLWYTVPNILSPLCRNTSTMLDIPK